MRVNHLLFVAMFLSGFSAQAQLKNFDQQSDSSDKPKKAILPLKPTQTADSDSEKSPEKNTTATDTGADKGTENAKSNDKGETDKPAKPVKKLSPEEFEKKAIAQAQKMVQSRLEDIRTKANSTESLDKRNVKGYVLSTYLKNFPDISPTISAEIKQTKAIIKRLIEIAATDIEMQGDTQAVFSTNDKGEMVYKPLDKLSDKQNSAREKLLKANLENNISVRTAVLAVQLLVNINEELASAAEKAKTDAEKEAFHITQAIYFYEMSNIVLELLEELSLAGEEAIFNLYSAEKVSATDRIAEINMQIKRAQELQETGMLTKEQLASEVASYQKLTETNVERLAVWDTLLESIAQQSAFIQTIKKNKDMLIYKRDKAKLQLTTLRDLRSATEMQDAIGALEVLTETLSPMVRSTLDDESVRDLLGY